MKTFLVLVLLANLAYFAWREGWTGDWFPAPVVESEVPVEPAFEQAPRRLVLLQELPGTAPEDLDPVPVATPQVPAGSETPLATVETVAIVVEPQTEPVPVAAQPWCGQLSGFADEAAANAWLTSLPAGQGEGEVTIVEVPVSSTWWVHMPAFESEAVALRTLEELQDNSIDSYYMRSGQLRGGISLGVFSRQESALTAQAQLARRGYATSIAEVFRMEDRPVLQLRLLDAAWLQSPQWQDLVASQPDLQVAENACEIIAPTSQFP
jgi:hypothetical protein